MHACILYRCGIDRAQQLVYIHATPTELLAYLKRIVETHKLLEPGATGSQAGKPIVRLSTEVTEARWDGAGQRWVVRAVNNGES